MKVFKVISCILICVCIGYLSACKNETIPTQAVTMEQCIAYEISNMVSPEDYDDEVIKALSVIIRTDYVKNLETKPEKIESEKINSRVLELVTSTSGEVLFDGENLVSVSFLEDEINDTWTNEIKKADILRYMQNNGIYLSNISNINIIADEDGNLLSLNIAGKEIPYDSLSENFNLKSNKIKNIQEKTTSIVVTGQTEFDKNCFYLSKFKNSTQKNDKNYREILKNHFDGFEIITM